MRGQTVRFPINRIFCVGRNYHAHAVEMNRPVDKASMSPFYFLKDASTTIESGATVPYATGTHDYHYEMELVVAIGAEGFRLAEADAEGMIYGYCAGLDMTRRDLQLAARETGRPWDLGKERIAPHQNFPSPRRDPCDPAPARRILPAATTPLLASRR